MAEKKERKPWNKMTYRELDEDALFEHALSLGKEKETQERRSYSKDG